MPETAPLPVTVCSLCESDALGTPTTIGDKTYCEWCVFTCEGCQETQPDSERAECEHWSLCQGCAGGDWCLSCANEDAFYERVDRDYAASKEGWI